MEFTTFRLKDTEYTRVSKTIHNKQAGVMVRSGVRHEIRPIRMRPL